MAHPELQWISDLSALWWLRRVISLSACLRILLTMRVVSLFSCIPFRRDDKYFFSCFHILYSICLLLFLHHAWQTLRGRCILGFWYVNPYHAITFDLSVTCFLLTHVYHLVTVLSPDHLTCHYLARPLVMSWLTQTYYQSLVMHVTWWISPLVMLSFDTKHDVHDFVIIMLRESCLVIMELSATRSKVPHHTVGATSWICGGHL